MTERWLPVPGWEGLYFVSDHGRVRSEDRVIERRDGVRQPRRGRVLKPFPVPSGHLVVTLGHSPRKQEYIAVHRIVLNAFVGPLPAGMETLHRDDDPTNNHLGNLRYGTRSENLRDMVRNGRHFQANKTHCPRNHEYTAENTYIGGNGGRNCRACRLERQAEALAARPPRPPQVSCRRLGHDWTNPRNVYYRKSGKRICAECVRLDYRARSAA